MKEKDITRKYCDNLIMNLNAFRLMDENEKKKDLRYGVFLCAFMIFIPMIIMIVFILLEKTLWGVLLSAASFCFALWYGLNRRKQIIRNFYQNENGAELVDLQEGTGGLDEALVDPLCIACILPVSDDVLNVIYNWLCNRKFLENGERLRIMKVKGAHLKDAISAGVDPSADIMLIMTPHREPDSWLKVRSEMGILNMVFLEKLLKKEEGSEEKTQYSGPWADWVTK